MARVLVLYYSSYGHIETMAYAVAEGARQIPGTEVVVKCVPELVPPDVAQRSGYKLDQKAEICTVAELPDYDAIIIGTPGRFGMMASQVKQFIDQAGGHWLEDRMVGKVGSVFTSAASQHGGHESTIITTHTALLVLGMVVVGLPYSFRALCQMDEIGGGSPFGASTVCGADGSLQPTATDLAGARFQGQHVADIASRLVAGRS